MVRPKRAVLTLEEDLKGSPFLKCVVSIWTLPLRGRWGVRACQDGLGHFFSTFARLTEEEGGGSKAIWAIPTLLKKGLPVVKMKHKQWSGNHHQDQSQR